MTTAGGLYAGIEHRLTIRAADVVLADERQPLTGAELLRRVARCAAALGSAGVVRGDRVAVQTEKSLAQVILYLAILRCGAIYVPLNTAYRSEEVGYFLADSEPRLLVCDPGNAAALEPLASACGAAVLTLDGSGSGTLNEAIERAPPAVSAVTAGSSDLATIVYTSGTTGRAKGAMLTHGNLLDNAHALISAWDISANDVLLHALPLFHIHGLFVALNPLLLAGGRVQLLRSFDPVAVIAGFPSATLFMGVPTHYTRLLATGALNRHNTATIRAFICGSAPLLVQTFREFEAATGQRLIERYGMSECGIICSNPLNGARVPGAVGLPLAGVELRIAAESGAPVERGAAGMIEVRGPHVCAGYWRMPVETAAERRDDGYFRTGDIGRVDAAGYLHIVGRSKDLVITGGLNVYPKEIELLLDAMPGVEESAVIGLPHPDFGEAVAAVITRRAAAAPPDVESLLASARRQLAAFKVPKVVFVVDELPRNAMGKVQKAELRRRYATTFAVR